MQFRKLDSRRMRVTDLPSSVDGIRLGIQEMEVIVAYSGEGSVRRGLAIDHCVMPLVLAAPALYEALQDMLDEADLGAVDEETRPIVERARAALAMARPEEVNA